MTTLIVRAAFGDGFAARAECGHGHDDGDDEIHAVIIQRGLESHVIVHHSRCCGDGRFLFQKERELEGDVRFLRVQAAREVSQDVGHVIHVQFRAEFIQHFHEAAHVRAFELVRQIHRERGCGDGVLEGAGFVAHLHRVAQSANTHSIDGDAASVRLALRVVQLLHAPS